MLYLWSIYGRGIKEKGLITIGVMAIIETEGKFPKRIGNYVLYRRYEKIVLREISGFTTVALKNEPNYALSRQNASEFGRVSALCKHLREALSDVLPKQHKLVIVNAFTKKMREVMTYDVTAARGERQLAMALTTIEGKQQLLGYNFNPAVAMVMNYQLKSTALLLRTKGIVFPKTANYIGFRGHQLVFDFVTGASVLESGGWVLESEFSLRNTISLSLPNQPNAIGVVLSLLEIQFYHYKAGTYIPLADDVSKSLIVVGLY
jgi:hypothetical protein